MHWTAFGTGSFIHLDLRISGIGAGVGASIYLSTYLPIYPSTHLPIYPSTHLPIYPSTFAQGRPGLGVHVAGGSKARKSDTIHLPVALEACGQQPPPCPQCPVHGCAGRRERDGGSGSGSGSPDAGKFSTPSCFQCCASSLWTRCDGLCDSLALCTHAANRVAQSHKDSTDIEEKTRQANEYELNPMSMSLSSSDNATTAHPFDSGTSVLLPPSYPLSATHQPPRQHKV
jgi:hypothetical protein